MALCFVLGELVVDGVLDGATKWRLKCFGAFSDFDGGGSGVGFGEAVAKVLVLHGSFDEVFGGARLGRLVCSFLVNDFPFRDSCLGFYLMRQLWTSSGSSIHSAALVSFSSKVKTMMADARQRREVLRLQKAGGLIGHLG